MYKRESLITTEEKLLFDILQELKEINRKPTPATPEPARPIAKATEGKVKGKVTCKVCGKQFDNRGKFFQHMKEHKKEGA